MANTLKLFRNGAVGFIDWLDGGCAMKSKASNKKANNQRDDEVNQPPNKKQNKRPKMRGLWPANLSRHVRKTNLVKLVQNVDGDRVHVERHSQKVESEKQPSDRQQYDTCGEHTQQKSGKT